MSCFSISVDGLFEDAGGLLRFWGSLRVILLLDRHHMESVEAGQHRTANPGSILSVKSGTDRDLCLCVLPGQIVDLLIESLLKVSQQSCSTGEHNVVVQVDLQVRVDLLN